MPEAEIIPIDAKGLARHGGALNCISWNVKL
jgi:agmatine/peptidylarginine deiminase